MKINIKSVLAEVNRPNSIFAVRYRRVSDGLVGQHQRCALMSSGRTTYTGQKKKWNRSGQLRLTDLDSGSKFQVYIDLLTHFNDIVIEHRQ